MSSAGAYSTHCPTFTGDTDALDDQQLHRYTSSVGNKTDEQALGF
jgi:hypothetical protein